MDDVTSNKKRLDIGRVLILANEDCFFLDVVNVSIADEICSVKISSEQFIPMIVMVNANLVVIAIVLSPKMVRLLKLMRIIQILKMKIHLEFLMKLDLLK